MGDGGVADLGADVSAIGLEEPTGELATVVRDDAVGDAEATDQALDELHRGPGRNGLHSFHLHPLDELVDGDEEEPVVPERTWEWPEDVQPPDRERP